MADLRFFVTQEGTLNQGGSGNDTIFAFTGTQSADTIKGQDGDDLISFANQTTAITVRANNTKNVSAGAGSAGFINAIYSGAYVSAGTIFNGTNTAGTITLSAGLAEISAQVQTLQLTGLQVARSTLIAGGVGNDSIFLGNQMTTFDATSVRGGQGNDILGSFNSGANTAGILSKLSGSEIKGGGGNDTVFINLSGDSATDFRIAGNDGDDTVMFSANSAEINSGHIGGGAGNDTVFIAVKSSNISTLAGGKGNDSLNITISAATNSTLIQGDATGVTGLDTINLDLSTFSSTTVLGGEGADSIVLSGSTDNGSNLFDAGGGVDTVFFQSAGADTISGSTIAGAAGNDSILFQAMSAGVFQSGLIKGGAGNDSISITDLQDAGSAGVAGGSVKGGGGADVISISAVGGQGGGGSATFVYTKYNESTLDSLDTLTFNTAAVSADGDATFASSKIHINVDAGLNTGVSGAGAVGQVSASGGFIVFSGYNDNSLTARVSAINAGYTTTGDFAVFTTNNTTRYLFVQGGTTDLVAKLSDDNALSAGVGSLVRSGNTIGLGF